MKQNVYALNSYRLIILEKCFSVVIFFSIRFFFHEHSRIAGLQGKGEGISLTPHCYFHPLFLSNIYTTFKRKKFTITR